MVWLSPGAGFVGESNRLRVTIMPEECPPPCILDCGDPECREWTDVETEPDADGEQYILCHVSECQMFDEPQSA